MCRWGGGGLCGDPSACVRADHRDVGQAVPVFDALDNQPLGQGPRVRVPFKQGETRLLRY